MDYIKYIEEYKDEMIETLCHLISIKSVREESVTTDEGEIYPFGHGVQKAYEYTMNKAREMGFKVENIDNYGGHIEMGTGKEIMGIIGHLDVVPEGEGWDYQPYGGEIVDDIIYGRGTTDDKGPVVACLYAMKALKEAGFVPKQRIRLILGLDEETCWDGIEYYEKHTEMPDYGFTPDADFPAINGEKGILVFDIAKKFSKTTVKGLELTSIKGGNAANMVAEYARAVVRAQDPVIYDNIKELGNEFRAKTGYKINFKGVGKSLEITTYGKSAHGASPQLGVNGISIMMEFLGKLNFVNEDVNDFIGFYNEHIGFDLNGSNIGSPLEDEASGKLTFNVGIIDMTKEAVKLTVNVRYPVSCTEEQVYKGMEANINKYNLGIIKEKNQPPIYMDPESPMIKTLMDVYQKHTGDTDSKPLVIGGGTYARIAKNLVGFGAALPGEEDRMHQKNECISIDKLMLITKIYADAIYGLSEIKGL